MFDVISRLIGSVGEVGVFLLMLIENLFPPIPSEIIMPMAGAEAAAGRLTFIGVVFAGTFGSVLGALGWYWMGRWLGQERLERWTARHGRWLTLHPQDIRKLGIWFARAGPLAVCLGRTLPGIRGMIAIPAGLSGMSFIAFTGSCFVGSLIWSTALTWAGFLLGRHYDLVGRWINPVTTIFLGFFILCYLYRVATYRHRR